MEDSQLWGQFPGGKIVPLLECHCDDFGTFSVAGENQKVTCGLDMSFGSKLLCTNGISTGAFITSAHVDPVPRDASAPRELPRSTSSLTI
jgi:hypothetical protein